MDRRKKSEKDAEVSDQEDRTPVTMAHNSNRGLTPIDRNTAAELRSVGSKTTSYIPFVVNTDTERAEIEASRTSLEQIEAESQKPPILVLPPEIRLRVYEFVLKEKINARGRLLAVTLMPTLARVCREFRTESLPLFFAGNKFVIPLGTNLHHRAQHGTVIPRLGRCKPTAKEKRSGVLSIKQPVKEALRYAGNKAVFRNVKFKVYNIDLWDFRGRVEYPFDRGLIVELTLVFQRGHLSVDAVDKKEQPAKMPELVFQYTEAESQEFDIVIDDIRRIAAELEAKKGFRGLKLNDLERIARVFRFKEPIVASGNQEDEDDDR